MKKVFRKHNASTLQDAFLKKVLVRGTDLYYLTWTQNEDKAAIFESESDAQLSLYEWTKDCTNNYSYTYSIINPF